MSSSRCAAGGSASIGTSASLALVTEVHLTVRGASARLAHDGLWRGARACGAFATGDRRGATSPNRSASSPSAPKPAAAGGRLGAPPRGSSSSPKSERETRARSARRAPDPDRNPAASSERARRRDRARRIRGGVDGRPGPPTAGKPLADGLGKPGRLVHRQAPAECGQAGMTALRQAHATQRGQVRADERQARRPVRSQRSRRDRARATAARRSRDPAQRRDSIRVGPQAPTANPPRRSRARAGSATRRRGKLRSSGSPSADSPKASRRPIALRAPTVGKSKSRSDDEARPAGRFRRRRSRANPNRDRTKAASRRAPRAARPPSANHRTPKAQQADP